MDMTQPIPDRQPQLEVHEITDPDERLRLWAETHAGDLELEPLPRWQQPSPRKAAA